MSVSLYGQPFSSYNQFQLRRRYRYHGETDVLNGQSRYVDRYALCPIGPKFSSVSLYRQPFSTYSQFQYWRPQLRWRHHGKTKVGNGQSTYDDMYLLLTRGPKFSSVSLYVQPFPSYDQFKLWRRKRRWRHHGETDALNGQSRYVDRYVLLPRGPKLSSVLLYGQRFSTYSQF